MEQSISESKLRIIVGGFIGLFPAGGVTWDYIQYPLGFAEMGHDVFYIEDTRLWPIFQSDDKGQVSCALNVKHLSNVMNAFGLSNRWAYRDEISGTCFGMTEGQILDICKTANVFVNISCSTVMRKEYQSIPKRVLIDSDPMFTQIQYQTELMFTKGKSKMKELVDAHTHHFTFGLNIGAVDCRVPTDRINWVPTLQPICLSHWPVSKVPSRSDTTYTTVMNWNVAPPIEFDGETWGQKNVELQRILALPEKLPKVSLSIAVAQTTGTPFPKDAARRHGWQILDPVHCVPDWKAYRTFIQGSKGELSVAKETYVKALTGWFSCRSACYICSGRPVVTQDTGWSRYLPDGIGLLSFTDEQSAIEALKVVEDDPVRHGLAAREIAEQFFDSRSVLSAMLEQLGV